MEIYEEFCLDSLTSQEEYKKIMPDGLTQWERASVIIEHRIEIIVNKKLAMDLVCTPEHLPELVLGRLLSEGIIGGVGDVEYLELCESGHQAKVFLKKGLSNTEAWEDPGLNRLPAASDQVSWAFQLAKYFAQGSPLHRKTVGTHSCILAVEGEILCHMEDIGRHNALDKALGCALRQEAALNHAMLYTSGRVPTDMVKKVIRADVPVLVSKGVPTLQSIALAREAGLMLITSARPDMVKLW